MYHLWQDLKFAARRLRKSPGFTAVALAVLALGIGATATLFSAVKAVLLEPLAYADPERIYALRQVEGPTGELANFSYPTFLDYEAGTRSWAALGAFRFGNYNLSGAAEPEQIRVAHVSPGYFDVFGLRPIAGRTFTAEENGAVPQPVVVLGYQLWQRQLGGRADVVGETLDLDREAHVIVGVMPPEMDYPGYADLWMPLGDLSGRRRDQRDLSVLGRLADGVDARAAGAEMSAVASRLAGAHPEAQAGYDVALEPLTEVIVGDSRAALMALLAATGAVLLIACLNIATLQTVRGLDRRREVAVRTALGAGGGRVVRELLIESLLLAACGGALGVLAASWSLDLLTALAPSDVPRLGQAAVDWTVLGFAALLTAVTGVLFGLVPALQTVRFDVAGALSRGRADAGGGARGGPPGGARGFGLRARLVVAQVALTLVLLVGAGLLMKSFLRLLLVDPGFEPERVVSLGLVMPPDLYPGREQRVDFIREATDRVRRLPGVENAAAINFTPFGYVGVPVEMEIVGAAGAESRKVEAAERTVAAGYFETLGIPLVAGRSFDDDDDAARPPVAVVNQTLARRHWGGASPIGERLRQQQRDGETRVLTVVGVAADVKHAGLAAPVEPAVYRPHAQEPWNYMNLVARAAEGPPERLIPAIQRVVWDLDPDRPMFSVGSLTRGMDRELARPRFSAVLTATFSAFALLLAAVGLYSVMAFSVSRRGRELGIRLALGARRRKIHNMVVGQGMTLVALGLAAGLVAALLVSRLLESLLYAVGSRDLATFVAVPLVLSAAAYLATYLPAVRASRVDPAIVLREQ